MPGKNYSNEFDTDTPRRAISVKECATTFAQIIKGIPPVWVEGEISQLNARPGSGVVYLTLRDLNEDYNIPLKMFTTYYKTLPPLKDNARVLVKLRPDFWANAGRMSFHVDELQQTGVGDLFARLEALKNKLFEEGLFDPKNKLPIPFLPNQIGIICGRESDAKKDVVENARRKWPAAKFKILEVAVQGNTAVKEVSQAFQKLNQDNETSVIVITRGGGSFEDLLVFSDESLLRLIATRTKPVISAIGHEKDQPLLDLVSDWRASTPTDAGKKVVPDYLQELEAIKLLRKRLNRFIETFIDSEYQNISYKLERAWKTLNHQYQLEKSNINSLSLRLTSLSPQSILNRGFAVVTDQDKKIIRNSKEVKPGQELKIKLAKDEILATVKGKSK